MQNESYTAARELIYLVSCAVNQKTPENDRVNKMDLSAVYMLASAHSLCSAAACALESAGVADNRFVQARAKAMRKAVLFEAERQRVYAMLEKHRIWYLPLKGAVLQADYPVFGMREMADTDILCDPDRMADVRSIMEALGFICTHYGVTNQDVYEKAPSISFEMHRCLFEIEKTEDLYHYFLDIKKDLIPVEGKEYAFRMSPEDSYLYMLAHEYKHYARGGTGLRSLLDVYVFLLAHEKELHKDLTAEKLREVGLADFERMNRELSKKIFSGEEPDVSDMERLGYFLSSGTYGNTQQKRDNLIANSLRDDDTKSSKLKYIGKRVFPSEYELRTQYPFYYRHKAFLPILWTRRFFRGVFVHPKTVFSELKEIIKYKKDK